MNPMQILKEVEADVKSFGSISGDIRAKLKSGVADLTKIRDEMTTLVETVTGKAKDALASLKAVADEVSKDADEEKDDAGTTLGATTTASVAPTADAATSPAVAAVMLDTGAPAAHVEPAVDAHAEAVAAGSAPDIAHADAQSAAAAAGASPEMAATIAASVATMPVAEAAAEPVAVI